MFSYLFKWRKEIQRDTLGTWKSKGHCKPKGHLENIYMWTLHMIKGLRLFSSRAWSFDSWMTANNSSSLPWLMWFELWECWSVSLLVHVMLFSVIFRLFSYTWVIWVILRILCLVNYFLSMLCLMWYWTDDRVFSDCGPNWLFHNLELLHFT